MMQSRPPRTLGISLAILISVLWFTIIPFLRIGFTYYIRANVYAVPGSNVGDSLTGTVGLAGVTNTQLILRLGAALLFLVIAGFAWRGRPPQIRFVLVGSVLLYTAANVFQGLRLLFFNDNPDMLLEGFDSASGGTFLRPLLTIQFLFPILIALYVVWYLNRGPARAFFRGAYLPDPSDQVSRDS